mgnify:CR=1 FL=1
MISLDQKYEKLCSILRSMESVVIGYSGGVDSTFLAKVATDLLGDRALSVAAISESYPQHEQFEAAAFAQDLGLHFLTIQTSELDNPDYLKNAPDRCYHCKHELIAQLREVAIERGINAVVVGTNYDDLGDYRPGQQAVKEAGVRSPLVQAEMTKEDIRLLSRRLGIPTRDKPSVAGLSSRFPYGEASTREKLDMVDRAEQILREHHFRQFRVRHHDKLARIEVSPQDMQNLLSIREEITQKFRTIGYQYIAMDLIGYRTGSMNEVLHRIEMPAGIVK